MSIPETSDTREWGDYPRPSLAVDVAVLTVRTDTPQPLLALLVIRRRTDAERGKWDIPGAFVLEKERLADAARRALQDKAGVSDLEPVELGIFDRPDRDPRGWVVSVAYSVTVPFERLAPLLDARDIALAPVRSRAGTTTSAPVGIDLPGDQRDLPFDHHEMVERAVADLRRRYEVQPDPVPQPGPDPDGLMTQQPFTVTQLRQLYDAINSRPVQRDAFARRFVPRPSLGEPEKWHLRPIPGSMSATGGRPAQMYEMPE